MAFVIPPPPAGAHNRPMPTDRTTGGLTWAGFIEKWSRTTLPERAASQEHFLDLCRLLNQPTPAELRASSASFGPAPGSERKRGRA